MKKTDLAIIYGVVEVTTQRQRDAGMQCWQVLAAIDGDRQHPLSLRTVNPWVASRCELARDHQATMRVTYKPTPYFDRELLSIEALSQ